MKRTNLCFILMVLLLFLTGCSLEDLPNKPVRFYYPNAEVTYGSESGAFSFELREGESLSTEAIITHYLNGPEDQQLVQPFPAGTKLVHLEIADEETTLVLSDEYAELSGLSLSIANACLSKTLMVLTERTTVILSCKTKPLDGQSRISITEEQLVLFDQSIGATSSTSESNSSTKQ